jgi:hypothetical protein
MDNPFGNCFMHKLILLCVVVMGACGDHSVHSVAVFEQSDMCSRFSGYSTQIMHGRETRMVAQSASSYITFTREFGHLKISENKNFEEARLKDLLLAMESLKIVGFSSGDNYCIFFSTLSDSTYLDLRKHKRRFFDKNAVKHTDCINENCPYLLNFINTPDLRFVPKSIRDLHSIHKLKDHWYYFRSYEYSKYSKF